MDETKQQAQRPEFVQELRSLPRYQDMYLRMRPEDRPPKCDICNRSQVCPPFLHLPPLLNRACPIPLPLPPPPPDHASPWVHARSPALTR